mmetsp:Transcript_5870/g.9490  ORF Transcript_5870/g.9490 Transcript_5870/m.9490 type:complete len:237 (+) Transcript_5870:113-823(+)
MIESNDNSSSLNRQSTILRQLETIHKSNSDADNKIFKLKSKNAPTKSEFDSIENKGKNLDQYFIDNPPIKDSGGLLLTEFVIVGDERTAHDSRFLNQYQVSHILNTCGHLIVNIFDPLELYNPTARAKLEMTHQTNSALIGKLTYFTINEWEEHKVNNLQNLAFLTKVYEFIESAVQQYKSCLIVSPDNKCATVVIGIVYMMMKYKWTVHKTLEYICSRKSDIEITKTIIKHLQQL